MKNKNIYELTNPQKSILFTEQFYSDTTVNNICTSAIIYEEIDETLLKKAIYNVVKQNDSFRIHMISCEDNTIKQLISDFTEFNIDVSYIDTEDDVKLLQEEEVKYKFEFLNSDLFKFKIFILKNKFAGVILTVNHIIADSWSLGLVIQDILKNYHCLKNNTPIESSNYSYTNYINLEEEYKSSKRFQEDKKYWEEMFQTIPEQATIPSFKGNLKNVSNAAERLSFNIDKNLLTDINVFCKENNISVGINIDEDNKRSYPYGSLASQVIGFCGSDNQGLTGIEYKWDSVLTGTPGKIVSSKDSLQKEIPNAEETYIAAENGSDITLTIDINIQKIVEKYLKQAVEDNVCKKGGNVIVMDPQTGDILAMASYPDYDLNTPFTPNSTIASTYSNLSTEQKSAALQNMWKNKSVSNLYEPGSVFKIITAAIAVEENITTTDKENDFVCTGYEEVADRKIACWKYYDPHGYQTLRKALMNSCNPAFMQLGKRIGTTTLYKYYKAFGLFDKTGVALAGEENSIFHPLKDVGPVELATMSFGQRFSITPLQMITAISCVANDGVLVQPRIVKSITNTDTGAVSNIETTTVRQVISKETATKVKSMMESVVTKGTGRHGAVNGYSIGGKTGTSEPTENNKDDGYVASYVAISPIENTQVALLLTLYDPSNGNHQGGQVAGPVVSQMLSEILPYLDVPSDSTTSESDSSNLITLPEIRNKTVSEAEKVLKDAGFSSIKISCSGDPNSTLVADQVPKPGIKLQKSATIMVYSSNDTTKTSVAVPDLKDMNASQATETLKAKNLNIQINGTGNVITQDYSKDTLVEEGTVITVTLKNTLVDAH